MFSSEQLSWEEAGIVDYTVRYSVRRTTSDVFRVVEIAVADGTVVGCSTEGDWEGITTADVCADSPAEPIPFVLALVEAVDMRFIEASISEDWHYIERLVYDDPGMSGEERLVTVLRFDGMTPMQALWEQADISDYRIVYEIRNLNGMGGSPGDGRFEVTVREGRVTECRTEGPSDHSDGFCDGSVPDPIDLPFSRLADFDTDHTAVQFNPDWHFPESIDYDAPNTADEEYRIRVHEFEVLRGP